MRLFSETCTDDLQNLQLHPKEFYIAYVQSQRNAFLHKAVRVLK